MLVHLGPGCSGDAKLAVIPRVVRRLDDEYFHIAELYKVEHESGETPLELSCAEQTDSTSLQSVRSWCSDASKTEDCSIHTGPQQRSFCRRNFCVFVGWRMSWRKLIGANDNHCRRWGWCHSPGTRVLAWQQQFLCTTLIRTEVDADDTADRWATNAGFSVFPRSIFFADNQLADSTDVVVRFRRSM